MRKKLTAVLAATMILVNGINVYSEELGLPAIDQILPKATKEVVLQLGNTLAIVNGEKRQLDVMPMVNKGTTYLPFRFIANVLLEADVAWDGTAKRITITKDNKIVEITVGAKEARVNGEIVVLSNAPVIDKGITFLPLRAVADLFGIQTDYDAGTKNITLTKEESVETPAISPTLFAKFSFEESMYTEGQTVKVVEESYDESGAGIADRLWMINFNEKQTSAKLENIFKTPKPGLYSVSLKVRNTLGMWSGWTTQEILINPNQKPVITKLETGKASYAQGEELEFTYAFENEPWEGIKAERWTYREIDEPIAKSVADKPQFIFNEGQYIVSLQLQDDFNNWSERQEVIVTINEESKQKELEYRFKKGSIGDIIDNFKNFNYQTYKEIFPSEVTFGEGVLMMSDSPESVKAVGILYRDTLSGTGRILIHHCNDFTEEDNLAENKRLVLMAENKTDTPASFILSNRIIKGPSEDTLFVGQQLLYAFLKGDGYNSYTLNPGEKMYIYDSGNRKWGKNQLISGKADFQIDGKITFTVAAIGKNTAMNEIELLPNLAKDVHPRGTFNTTDIYQKIDLIDDEPVKLLLGKGDDEWAQGYDAITGEAVKNRGNFGIVYHLKITAKHDTGVILNPRGGIFRGAVKWDGNKVYLTPSKGFFSGHNSKAVMIGNLKAGETRTLEYVLPNGSASPVLIGFIPSDYWNK